MHIANLNIKINDLEKTVLTKVCFENNKFEGFVVNSQNPIFIKGFVRDEFMSFELYEDYNNDISTNEYIIGKNGDGYILNKVNNTAIHCHVDFKILILDEYDENLMLNELKSAIKLWKNNYQKSLLIK